jgi:hypothetical protein
VIESDSKKTEIPTRRILFPRMIKKFNNEEKVEYSPEELPTVCHQFLTKIWDEKVAKIDHLPWEKILQVEE